MVTEMSDGLVSMLEDGLRISRCDIGLFDDLEGRLVDFLFMIPRRIQLGSQAEIAAWHK